MASVTAHILLHWMRLKKKKGYCGHKATVSNAATWSHKTKTQAFGKAALATTPRPLCLCFQMWRGSRDDLKITKLESWPRLVFVCTTL